MFSIPTDFPLSITTHPLYIALGYLSYGILLLVGIGCIDTGRRSSSQAGVMQSMEQNSQLSWYKSIEDLWRKRLRTFRVVTHEDPTVLKEVMLTWDLMRGPSQLASGLRMVLGALISLLLLILTGGTIFRNIPLLFALGIIHPLSILPQSAITYGIGFRRVRQAATRHRLTYADLRKRHLSDYRSGIFRWLLALLISANALLLLLFPFLLSLSVPAPLAWERLVICLGMLAIFIVGELCLSYTVTLPRLVVTPNPTVAQHADDMLRALTIQHIHTEMFIIIGHLLWLQWFYFLPWLLSSPFLLGIQIFTTILCLLCWTPTALRSRNEGRLGGKKTGWPWKAVVVS